MRRILLLSLFLVGIYAAAQTQGLPNGFILTPSGLVCMGTGAVCNPTATIPLSDVGNYVFNVTACDANNNCSPSTAISLSIGANCQVTVTPTTLAQGFVGKTYAGKLTANGTACTAPFVFSLQ